MKLNNCIFVALFYFVLTLLTQAGESVLPRIDSSEPAFRGMDSRLLAIAANPELLAKLDQKNLYQTKEAYQKVLNRSLREISFLMPAKVSSGSVSNLVTAFCVYDAKVFFWLPELDQDLVGWVSLPGRNSTTGTKKCLSSGLFRIKTHPRGFNGQSLRKSVIISLSTLSMKPRGKI